jgi:hypothetical protein
MFFMVNNYKILSIDESGKASFEHASKLFILSAVLIKEDFRPKLDVKIRRLKKKFFKDENIVFHSRDMSRKKGQFSLLRDSKNEILFWSEFISILNSDEISFIFVITDKQRAKKLGWQPKTILKRSYLRLAQLFLTNLTKDQSKGKIVAESDPSQDLFLMEAHAGLQSLNHSYRNSVTSISFVKKTNLDPDVQIADALAPIAGMIFSNEKSKSRIEKIKVKLIERKLLNKQNPSHLESIV